FRRARLTNPRPYEHRDAEMKIGWLLLVRCAEKLPGRFAGQFSPIQDLKNSNDGSAAGDQVDDEHDQRGNQQQVNQAAGYMQTEPEEPENQQNGKYGPEHRPSLLSSKKLRWERLLRCCLTGKHLRNINRADRYNLEGR